MKEFKIDKSKWIKTKLFDLAEEISEREDNPGKSEYDRFVGLEHFVTGDLKIKKWTTTEGLTSAAKVFKAGDVLFARRNAYLRRASMVDFDGLCSGDAFVLRENHKKIIPGFLSFILNSDKLWDFANANAAGTMSKRVKWRDLGNYEILLPPKEQQAKLAELLWAGDNVVERYNSLNDVLHQLYLRLELELFPNSKKNNKLKDAVLRTFGGGTPDTKKPEFYENGTIEWITTSTMNSLIKKHGEKKINEKALDKSATNLLQAGNIIVGTRVGIGKCCIIDCPMAFSQDVTGIEINRAVVDNIYLALQIRSAGFQENILSNARGTTIKGILKEDLLNTKITLPKLEDQIIVRNKLLTVKKSQEFNLQQLAMVSQIQKQLINQIFS